MTERQYEVWGSPGFWFSALSEDGEDRIYTLSPEDAKKVSEIRNKLATLERQPKVTAEMVTDFHIAFTEAGATGVWCTEAIRAGLTAAMGEK